MKRGLGVGLGTIGFALLAGGCAGDSVVNVPSTTYQTVACQGVVPTPGFDNGVDSLPFQAKTLRGAGSTFVAPMMSVWTKQYATSDDVQIDYQSIGSGGGIAQLQANDVDFAASDAFMTDAEIAKAEAPVVQVPVIEAPVAAVYNLPGIKTGLKFDGDTLGKLFARKITNWNDPALAKLNPGISFPDLPVTIVHRSDSSGTTSIWTDFLTKESPAWVAALGGADQSVGKTVAWPIGTGANGNQGVTEALGEFKGTLGYVELAYALGHKLSYGYVKNKAGNFVEPCVKTAANAARGINYPPDLRVDIVDESTQPDGYPVTGLTWAIMYRNQTADKAAALVNFFSWVLTNGQDLAASVNYTPLGSDLQALCIAQLQKFGAPYS